MKTIDLKKEMVERALPTFLGPDVDAPGDRLTQWAEIRPSILEAFRKNVYGKPPEAICSVNVWFQEHGKKYIRCEEGLERRFVDIHFSNDHGEGKVRMLLFLPEKREGPVPVFLTLSSFQNLMWDPELENHDKFFPVRQIVQRGYGAALLRVDDAAPDDPRMFRSGIDAIVNPNGEREADSWGAIGMWAWAAQRAMDYLERNADIDSTRVMLAGCSRCGKTALWCSAQDERFFITFANVSGCGGAAVERGKQGERIADIVRDYPHWFCPRYSNFQGRERALPIDQHFLLALCAPRPLYIASAEQDLHADPVSEYLSCVAAQEVYKTYALPCGLDWEMPPPDVPRHGGAIGYHIRSGEHGTEFFDWDCYLSFADLYTKT